MFRVAATVTNSVEKAKRRYDTAARAGIVASSQHLLNEIKKAYQDYYTSGDFRSTLQIRQAWRRSEPTKGKDGWSAIVGVPTASVTPKGGTKPVDRGLVALGWELGHYNVFLRRKVRVPIAVPTATKEARAMREAWARVVKRYMEMP